MLSEKKSDEGRTVSVWEQTIGDALGKTSEHTPAAQGAAASDERVDVCIVGAGISGLSTAYALACAGKSVLVLDDGPISGGETARTTAHLSNLIDDGYATIEQNHGEAGARLAYQSHTRAIDHIEKVARDENIDCEFERLDGYLFLEEGEDTSDLDEEFEAAERAGLNCERLESVELDGFRAGPGMRVPRQGQFHPLKYMAGLVRGIESRGGRIRTSTRATDVQDAKDGEPARVETSNGVVLADAVVVATNSPFNDRVAMHTKQGAYRTFVIGARVGSGDAPRSLVWDMLDPYHYVRLTHDAEGDVLIIGGEDHKTGQEDDGADRFARLEAWGRQHFPRIGEIVFQWSGQVMEPSDGLAFIGRNPGDQNVYIATGDSGMGMTHGTIAGMLLSDLILGRENPWTDLYDPSRQMARTSSATDFAKENFNVAAQYADWLSGGDVESAEQIPPGEGAVLRSGLSKVAAYRDESGALHECSAVCPHLGCIVAWNTLEKSWDCPCHGSRFNPTGSVINGPSSADLKAVGADDE